MNIIAITTARNEQDLIEAFVRHTLAHCDRLLIIDHGSTDATPAILKSLQEEGLALEVFRDDTVGIIQTALMNRLSRRAATDLQADWIFCLDVDEFIQGDVRGVLSAREPSKDKGYLQYWLVNYVVRSEDDPNELNPVKRIRHRTIDTALSADDRGACKSIVSGELARQEGFFINAGNHGVTLDGREPQFEILTSLWLGHFSLRSPCQYGGKAVSALFQRYGQRSKLMGNWDFYEADYRRLRKSYTEFAREFVNIPLPWWSRTITGIECSPIDYRGGELLYTPTTTDVDQFIQNTLDLGLNMAQKAAETKSEEEAKTVFISLKDGQETIQKQSFRSNTATFQEHRFAIKTLQKRHRIILTISGGSGVIEIERVSMKFEDGSQREFRENDLGELITVAGGSVAAGRGSVQRFFSSQTPFSLIIWGAANQAIELVVHLRFLDQDRMVALAAGELSGFLAINKQIRKQEKDPALVTTPLGTTLHLTPLEQNCIAIGDGWRPIRYTGLWLAKDKGLIGLRFADVQKSKLKLSFEAILRKSNKALETETAKFSISANGMPASAHQFGKRNRQWFEIEITPGPSGFRGIDLLFEVEDSSIGFGIAQIKVEHVQVQKQQGALAGLLQKALNYLEPKEEAVAPKRKTFGLGEAIKFGSGGNGLEVATTGWAQPEELGSRAESQLTVLKIPTGFSFAESFTVKLLVQGGKESGILRLAWEDYELISWWQDAQTPQWVEITLPAGAARREDLLLLFRSSEQSAGFELRELICERA